MKKHTSMLAMHGFNCVGEVLGRLASDLRGLGYWEDHIDLLLSTGGSQMIRDIAAVIAGSARIVARSDEDIVFSGGACLSVTRAALRRLDNPDTWIRAFWHFVEKGKGHEAYSAMALTVIDDQSVLYQVAVSKKVNPADAETAVRKMTRQQALMEVTRLCLHVNVAAVAASRLEPVPAIEILADAGLDLTIRMAAVKRCKDWQRLHAILGTVEIGTPLWHAIRDRANAICEVGSD